MALVLAAVTGTTTLSYMLYSYFSEPEDINDKELVEEEKPNISKLDESCIISETLTPNNMNNIPKNKIISIKSDV